VNQPASPGPPIVLISLPSAQIMRAGTNGGMEASGEDGNLSAEF